MWRRAPGEDCTTSRAIFGALLGVSNALPLGTEQLKVQGLLSFLEWRLDEQMHSERLSASYSYVCMATTLRRPVRRWNRLQITPSRHSMCCTGAGA